MLGYGSTLTVRTEQRDRNGDLLGSPSDVTSSGWHIAPASPSERASGVRDTTTLQLDCYRPGPVDDLSISSGNAVLLAGDDPALPARWQVDGPLVRWGNDVWGQIGGAQVRLRRVEG